MKKSSKILIAILVVIILIVGVVLYGPMFYTGTKVSETGWITYEPIDELPEGVDAVVLTEDDFKIHPAFSVIFSEDNPSHTIALSLDEGVSEIPDPRISEKEGYTIYDKYPYVEYNGELYRCAMVMT